MDMEAAVQRAELRTLLPHYRVPMGLLAHLRPWMFTDDRPHGGLLQRFTRRHTWTSEHGVTTTGVNPCPREAAQMEVRVQLRTG